MFWWLSKYFWLDIELISKFGIIDDNFDTRLVDSIRIALEKWNGRVSISRWETYSHFSLHASCPICNYQIENLNISNFSFNSHRGACTSCHGLGSSTTFLETDIVKSELTLAEWCLLPWQGGGKRTSPRSPGSLIEPVPGMVDWYGVRGSRRVPESTARNFLPLAGRLVLHSCASARRVEN